jgi:hypothetical protein
MRAPGLTTDNPKSVIKPRYNKDDLARTVYTNAMRFILIEGASPLNALSGVGIGFDRSMNDLPSWVPDWNHTTHIQILDMQYSAGTQYKARINFNPKGGPIIHLDGLQFGQVKHLGAVHDVDSHMAMSENASFMNKWFADAEALARERQRSLPQRRTSSGGFHKNNARKSGFI